jgi:succinate dehydrogenase flavoprotein subunit
MVDLDHQIADLAARVSCPAVAALATCLETGRRIEIFTNISAASLSSKCPGRHGVGSVGAWPWQEVGAIMEVSAHDVLLVGGGGAGLRAAIAVAEVNSQCNVAVVSKVYPMRSHTVSAEGGAAAVIKPDDSLDEHARDTISGGDWLCDQDAVEAFVREAPEEMLRLEHWGCPWSRELDGHIAVRPFGGMKKMRTWFAADKTGFHMLHTLFQTSLKYTTITRYDEFFVTKLLVDDGRVQGVVAIELATGKIHAILAKAVILCTGGCGRVFPFTTNANIKTGDGMSLAYRAGAPLKDMEFVQYHPTGLPFTGILITEAARSEGGWMLNKDGYRYLQDYNLGSPQLQPVLSSMELGPRDRLSQAFVKELEKGRTIDTPYGPVVHLDLRHLGEKLINAKLPFVRELCFKYQGIDPVNELIPVRPVVHYMMGGVHTDINGATPLQGLFAAGEVACVSINGANRLGSNSLTECLVFGARAGRAAAAYAAEQQAPSGHILAQAMDEQRRLETRFLRKSGGHERIATIREDMQKTTEESAGIYRTGMALLAATETLRTLQERFRNIALDDHSQTFNTELVAALELSCMLDVAETIVQSALHRTESRGAHQRSDFPKRDDEKFLAHSLVFQQEDGSPRIDYLPVTITRWPPAERVYGR